VLSIQNTFKTLQPATTDCSSSSSCSSRLILPGTESVQFRVQFQLRMYTWCFKQLAIWLYSHLVLPMLMKVYVRFTSFCLVTTLLSLTSKLLNNIFHNSNRSPGHHWESVTWCTWPEKYFRGPVPYSRQLRWGYFLDLLKLQSKLTYYTYTFWYHALITGKFVISVDDMMSQVR